MERCIREVCHLALIVNWLSDKCTISQVELDHTYLTSNLYHTHAWSYKLIKLVECRTLWGEPERVHVQNMEQLHAHDRYQNVAEHKTSGHSTVYETNLQICTFAAQKVGQAIIMVRLASPACSHARSVWLLHAHGSNTPCALQDVSTLRWHSRRHAHRCGHWRGRSMWRVTSTEWAIVTMQKMASTDETFCHGVAPIAVVIE